MAVCVCAGGIAAAQDRQFILLSKLLPITEETGVGEVEEREVFHEVVLDGRAREDHPSIDVETVERGEGLAFAVLEAMTFVAEEESDRRVA